MSVGVECLGLLQLLAAPDLLPGWDQLPTFPIDNPPGNRPLIDAPEAH